MPHGSQSTLRLGLDQIAKPGCSLVIFPHHRFFELLTQRFPYEESLTDVPLDLAEPLHELGHGRLVRVILFPPDALMCVQSIDTLAQSVDRLFRAFAFQRRGKAGLRAVKKNNRSTLLMRGNVLFIPTMADSQNP